MGTWSREFWDGLHRQHFGVTTNHVRLEGSKAKRAFEMKLNWGPDFHLNRNARFQLTTTWDIDQIAEDFPFTKTRFNPWGGGQGSFLMVF